jgi:hypothetical protein
VVVTIVGKLEAAGVPQHVRVRLDLDPGGGSFFSLDGNRNPWSRDMARTYLVFGDIEGKLDALRVECTRCQRKGRYSVRKLIERYGRKAHMMKWREQLSNDCPKRYAPQLHDRCDLICPDLPKVL